MTNDWITGQWPKKDQDNMQRHIEGGGGVVVLHHAVGSNNEAMRRTCTSASTRRVSAGDLSATHSELVTLIDEQSRKLNDLASRLLSAGNLDVADFQPQCEALFVSDLVTAAIGTVCPEESRGRFACSIPRDEIPVLADRKLMATALAQLVDNAVKYSEPASPIGIAVALVNQEVTFTIESLGDPIPPGDRERVFDRFYRSSGAPNRPPGTGLGLSIVKRIVDAHRGRVWAESGAGGRSIFSIALPATPNRL